MGRPQPAQHLRQWVSTPATAAWTCSQFDANLYLKGEVDVWCKKPKFMSGRADNFIPRTHLLLGAVLNSESFMFRLKALFDLQADSQ